MNEMALSIAASLLESEDWAFATTLDASQASFLGTGNADYNGKAVVNWHLDFDVRSYGVKEINIVVDKFNLRGVKSTWQDDGPDLEEDFNIDWDASSGPPPGNRDEPDEDLALAMAQPNWTVNVVRDSNSFGSLVPHAVEINLEDQTIEITF
jgi:hypothetical protein